MKLSMLKPHYYVWILLKWWCQSLVLPWKKCDLFGRKTDKQDNMKSAHSLFDYKSTSGKRHKHWKLDKIDYQNKQKQKLYLPITSFTQTQLKRVNLTRLSCIRIQCFTKCIKFQKKRGLNDFIDPNSREEKFHRFKQSQDQKEYKNKPDYNTRNMRYHLYWSKYNYVRKEQKWNQNGLL